MFIFYYLDLLCSFYICYSFSVSVIPPLSLCSRLSSSSFRFLSPFSFPYFHFLSTLFLYSTFWVYYILFCFLFVFCQCYPVSLYPRLSSFPFLFLSSFPFLPLVSSPLPMFISNFLGLLSSFCTSFISFLCHSYPCLLFPRFPFSPSCHLFSPCLYLSGFLFYLYSLSPSPLTVSFPLPMCISRYLCFSSHL